MERILSNQTYQLSPPLDTLEPLTIYQESILDLIVNSLISDSSDTTISIWTQQLLPLILVMSKLILMEKPKPLLLSLTTTKLQLQKLIESILKMEPTNSDTEILKEVKPLSLKVLDYQLD